MNTWATTPWAGDELRGDPARHLDAGALQAGLAALNPAPRQAGIVAAVIQRRVDGSRGQPAVGRLDPVGGLDGDRWAHGKAERHDQVSAMNLGVARLIANGQSPVLFGNNLLLDLDLSAAHLPPGSRLQVGTAVLELSPETHHPCNRFSARFGSAAFRLTADRAHRAQRLRGVYLMVLSGGEVRPGDAITLLP